MVNSRKLTVLLSVGFSLLFSIPATAQLDPDRTLGTESSRVRRNVKIRGIQSDRIDGGARRGRNLFHSFREFNVGRGRGVYFSNPTGVENILTRVTGRNRSNILGRLGVLGRANLFVINPNGILFGKDASLDLRGSFYATTADGIKLGENGLFSAKEPQSSNLLTVQPGALFHNAMRNYLATIENQAHLKVDRGENIILSADSITSTGSLTAPGGKIKLEAINGSLSVGEISTVDTAGGGDLFISATGDITIKGTLDVSGTKFDLQTGSPLSQTIGNGGNVTLSSNGQIAFDPDSNIFSLGLWGGEVKVRARSLFMSNNSRLSSLTTSDTNSGNITIITTDLLHLQNGASILTGSSGRGDGANLNINTNSLRLENGGQIAALTLGEGKAGNLTVKAQDILLNVNSFLLTQVASGAKGDGGRLTINTNSLRLENGGQIVASTFGEGKTGNLTVKAQDILLTGVNSISNLASGLFTQVEEGAKGDGGRLTINTERLSLENGSQISASTTGEGNGGRLTINTDQLTLENGSQILASTFGEGKAGDLTVKAQDIVVTGVDLRGFGSGLFTQTRGAGDGGDLTINTNSLLLEDGAAISASTLGEGGNGGRLTIKAQDIVVTGVNPLIDNLPTGLFSQTKGTGNGGSIIIETNSLQVSDRAIISAESNLDPIPGAPIELPNITEDDLGQIGSITIKANSVSLIDNGTITVNSQSSKPPSGDLNNIDIDGGRIILDSGGVISAEANISQGANINITLSDRLVFQGNSSISTNSGSEDVNGNGGNIAIKSPFILAFPRNNTITANANGGRGGDINITTNAILGYPQYLTITAESQQNIDGTITFDNIVTNFDSGLVDTPTTPIDAKALIAENVCSPLEANSSFVLKGKGGLPSNPTDLLDSQRPIVEWSNLRESLGRRSRIDRSTSVVVEARSANEALVIRQARGWIKKPDGTIVLTAYPTESTTSNSPSIAIPNCLSHNSNNLQ